MRNLQSLHNRLINEGLDSDVFNIQYNRRPLSCVYLIRDYANLLYLTTLGEIPYTIEFRIPDDFSAPKYIDGEDYRAIASYFGFTGYTGRVFYPAQFLEEVDNIIDPIPHRTARDTDIVRIIGGSHRLPIQDRPYFCGWRHNPTGHHVSNENYILTRAIVGEAIANDLRAANISSCWTANPDESCQITIANIVATS